MPPLKLVQTFSRLDRVADGKSSLFDPLGNQKSELVRGGVGGTEQGRDELVPKSFFYRYQVCPHTRFDPAEVLPFCLEAVDQPRIGSLRVPLGNFG